MLSRRSGLAAAALSVWLSLVLSSAVAAHQDKPHADPRAAPPVTAPRASTGMGNSPAAGPFPLNLGGHFNLMDQTGAIRSDLDYQGRFVLLFFGYVNCKYMCSLTLRNLAQAVDRLGVYSDQVQPVLITVDPEFDTVAVLRRELAKIHPRFLGLTGSQSALAAAYRAYKIKPRRIGLNDQSDAVVSHTSYIYLLGRNGEVLTLLPPILTADRMAGIIRRYMHDSR